MKAIYLKLDNDVYQINQQTAVPTTISTKAPGTMATLNVDKYNKTVEQNITINTFKKPGVKSNKELYAEFVEFLKNNKITEIKKIQNFFKVYIDYTVFNNDKIVEHSAVIRPIKPIDEAILLGVATNNECVYRRVKHFKETIGFSIRDSIPYGIIDKPKTKYALKINNLVIFQDFSHDPEIHQSVYEVPYKVGSSIVQASVDNMKMVYSSTNEGLSIGELSVPFIPRVININLDIILANYIVAYSDNTINDILVDNIRDKYNLSNTDEEDRSDIVTGEDDTSGGTLLPDPDDNETADGKFDPNENGYFSYYERCLNSTPNALLVVEDLLPDENYNSKEMIRKSKVIKDIPDIETGEYVIFRESLNTLK